MMRGDFLLAAHGVHGDDGAPKGEALQKRRDCRDFVAFAVNRLLTQNQPGFMGKGIENMLRLAGLAVLRTTQGLAVDGDDAAPAPVGDPSREGLRKSLVVKGPKHRPEGFGRGDAILERQKTAKPLLLFLREAGDLVGC